MIYRITTGPLETNTFLITLSKTECFVLDPGGDEKKISDRLSELKLNLVLIVLSHGHYDHVAALSALKEKYPKAKVAISKEDSEYIGKNALLKHAIEFNKSGLIFPYPELQNALSLANDFNNKALDLPEADIILENGKILFDEWKVIATPGHTKGSVCLLNEKEKLLLAGDTIFWQGYGRVDLPGGDAEEILESIDKLNSLDGDTLVFPGHGKINFKIKDNDLLSL